MGRASLVHCYTRISISILSENFKVLLASSCRLVLSNTYLKSFQICLPKIILGGFPSFISFTIYHGLKKTVLILRIILL